MLYVYHFQPDSLIDNTKTMQKGFETDFDQWSFEERSKGLVPNCPITDFALLTGHKGLWGWPSDHKHLNSYEHWTSRNTHQFSIQSQFSWTSPNSIDIFVMNNEHISITSHHINISTYARGALRDKFVADTNISNNSHNFSCYPLSWKIIKKSMIG